MTEAAPLDATTWVDRHGDVLFRYAVASVRDRSAAEDLVQDTFLAAIGALDSFAHRSSERTWLVGILRHKIQDHFRRIARAGELGGERQPDLEKPNAEFDDRGQWSRPLQEWHLPDKALEKAEFWRAFDHCVDALPESLRTSFALREIEGLDSESLAGVLHTSKNHVWVLLSRARQRLRHCLEHTWFSAASE